MKTFIIKTLGCKVNQFESDVIAAELMALGWKRAEAEGASADLCIVNTCTVTGRGAMQSRQMIRRLNRENPGALMVATGCYASVAPAELRDTGCVDRVVPHAEKHRIPAFVAEMVRPETSEPASICERAVAAEDRFESLRSGFAGVSRTRPFLKIQDGCNAFCTYCIVPNARGRSVSMAPDDVMAAVRSLRDAGYHEVVLTGIHLGAYGLDLSQRISLYSLLCRILDSGCIKRIRLSSIEPKELTDDIIQLAANHEGICDHFHIPLQSGAAVILKQMGRPYTPSFFADRVWQIKESMPNAAIGADVLVGFPGENGAAFEETAALLAGLPIAYLHVFPFSPRRGTPACDYEDQVPNIVIKERTARLRKLGNAKKAAFSAAQQGMRGHVPVEGERDPRTGLLRGVTGNYLTVLFEGPDTLKDAFVPVVVGEPVAGLCVKGRVDMA
ncbi:MAG: tRNA (N(6)-L-threonylcarbamoyladenosine(37)-C(2))-methylthiotransferase MtaB [Thermodesulfobacteriota bacterium]|nr:tRNA (N(6)-L-threonylcarbamoyladenosine(37)-C(2))-methylthiotransferase MtaB [Thermodesulfobacteriota bacterium]